MDKLNLDIDNIGKRTFTMSIQGKVIEKGNIPKSAKEVCEGQAWLHVTMLELLVWFRIALYPEIKIDTLHVLVDSQLGIDIISRFIEGSKWEIITLHAKTLEDAYYLMNEYNDTRNNFVVIHYDENLEIGDIDYISYINTFDNAFREYNVDNPHEESDQQFILYNLKITPHRLLDVVNCQVIDGSNAISDEYSIISHVWGNAIYDCAIDVGTTYRTPLESREKLLKIISVVKALGRRYVWVDALCINQDNIDEKSDEIPLMGVYYANCQECIVLLEPQTDSMEEISSTFHICSRNFIGFENIVKNCEHTLDKCSAQFFNMLGTCKWITRVWTLQEALLPKVVRYVVCGSYMCEKAAINRTLKIMEESLDLSPEPTLTRWMKIKKNLHNDNGGVWRISLDANSGECLNPADRVFGLLGLTGYGSIARMGPIQDEFIAKNSFNKLAIGMGDCAPLSYTGWPNKRPQSFIPNTSGYYNLQRGGVAIERGECTKDGLITFVEPIGYVIATTEFEVCSDPQNPGFDTYITKLGAYIITIASQHKLNLDDVFNIFNCGDMVQVVALSNLLLNIINELKLELDENYISQLIAYSKLRNSRNSFISVRNAFFIRYVGIKPVLCIVETKIGKIMLLVGNREEIRSKLQGKMVVQIPIWKGGWTTIMIVEDTGEECDLPQDVKVNYITRQTGQKIKPRRLNRLAGLSYVHFSNRKFETLSGRHLALIC